MQQPSSPHPLASKLQNFHWWVLVLLDLLVNSTGSMNIHEQVFVSNEKNCLQELTTIMLTQSGFVSNEGTNDSQDVAIC
jgi:hypothetical protein